MQSVILEHVMPVNVVVGLQRGDEGKGRFVDMLAAEHDIVARFNGGNNAGHTVVLPDGRELKLHLVPSGIAYNHTVNIIGNGTLLDPVKLVQEFAHIESKGLKVTPANLKISSAAHLILPHHISEDELRETGDKAQGSTKAGIAPAASAKSLRTGLRAEAIECDLDDLQKQARECLKSQRQPRKKAGMEPLDEVHLIDEFISCAKQLVPYITDTVLYLNKQLQKPKSARVLAEGAQAFLLDIDHGMYPYTTSSSTTTAGVCSGLGIAPNYVDEVISVAKAVQSHVGGGPFVTEITDKATLKRLHGDTNTIDAERGTTTGRVRRLGCFDIPQIRRALLINGGRGKQTMALTKLDWVQRFGKQIPVCTAYKRNGKALEIAPDAAYMLEESEPVCKNLPGWDEDIQDVRKFKDLPKNAQDFVLFVENQTGVPVKMIGVGPKRDQVIIR